MDSEVILHVGEAWRIDWTEDSDGRWLDGGKVFSTSPIQAQHIANWYVAPEGTTITVKKASIEAYLWKYAEILACKGK